MKSIIQKLQNVLFDIDFTHAITEGIRDYNLQCGYKLKEQPGIHTVEDRGQNKTSGIHQQLTVGITKGLKVAG